MPKNKPKWKGDSGNRQNRRRTWAGGPDKSIGFSPLTGWGERCKTKVPRGGRCGKWGGRATEMLRGGGCRGGNGSTKNQKIGDKKPERNRERRNKRREEKKNAKDKRPVRSETDRGLRIKRPREEWLPSGGRLLQWLLLRGGERSTYERLIWSWCRKRGG